MIDKVCYPIGRKEADDMVNAWEIWLDQNPAFSFAGKDSDGDSIEDDYDYDNEVEDEEDGLDSGSRDRSDDADDDDGDTSRRIRRLEADNKKLQRELEAAVELLNKAAETEGQGDQEVPEGYVPQEDYDALVDLLRTDYVQHAISSFTKKDGTPKWDWEDPSAVYKFLDIDDLEIDVKSKVIDGLEDQLADIAERYPFMLKDRGRRREGSGSTGKPPRKSGAREQNKNPSIEALVAEFPALVD